jgi:hypothetical protein
MKMTLSEKSAEKAPHNRHPASRGAARYAVPGAAMLGGALLAAGGILFREQLNMMVRTAVGAAIDQGVSATRMFEGRKLLAYVGLQPRRPAMAVAWPALGLLAGIAAGSALTIWLAPRVTSSLRLLGAHPKQESNTNSLEPTVSQHP